MIRPARLAASLVALAALVGPVSAQPPAPKAPPKGPARTSPGQSLRVQVTMDQLHCIKTTERNILNKSDEVYLIVAGKAPAGAFKKRLPGEKDHYSFKNGQKAALKGWKNKSGKEVGRPMLWSGTLKPGEHVRLSMLMIESDRKLLPNVVGKVAGVVGQIAGVATGLLGGDSKAVSTLNKGISAAQKAIKADGHDYLGCVTVVVKNVNGKLQVKYVPGDRTKDLGKGQFDLTGSGARYKVTLNVK